MIVTCRVHIVITWLNDCDLPRSVLRASGGGGHGRVPRVRQSQLPPQPHHRHGRRRQGGRRRRGGHVLYRYKETLPDPSPRTCLIRWSSVLDTYWFQCGSGSSFSSQCGSLARKQTKIAYPCRSGSLNFYMKIGLKNIPMKVQKTFWKWETRFIC